MARGGESGEGVGRREPLASLEEDVGFIDRLRKEGKSGV